jgi:hypothetical protein
MRAAWHQCLETHPQSDSDDNSRHDSCTRCYDSHMSSAAGHCCPSSQGSYGDVEAGKAMPQTFTTTQHIPPPAATEQEQQQLTLQYSGDSKCPLPDQLPYLGSKTWAWLLICIPHISAPCSTIEKNCQLMAELFC